MDVIVVDSFWMMQEKHHYLDVEYTEDGENFRATYRAETYLIPVLLTRFLYRGGEESFAKRLSIEW